MTRARLLTIAGFLIIVIVVCLLLLAGPASRPGADIPTEMTTLSPALPQTVNFTIMIQDEQGNILAPPCLVNGETQSTNPVSQLADRPKIGYISNNGNIPDTTHGNVRLIPGDGLIKYYIAWDRPDTTQGSYKAYQVDAAGYFPAELRIYYSELFADNGAKREFILQLQPDPAEQAELAQQQAREEEGRRGEARQALQFARKPFPTIDFAVLSGPGTAWAHNEIPALLRERFGELRLLQATTVEQVIRQRVEVVIACMSTADYSAMGVDPGHLQALRVSACMGFGEAGARLFDGMWFPVPRNPGKPINDMEIGNSPLIQPLLLPRFIKPLRRERSGNPEDFWMANARFEERATAIGGVAGDPAFSIIASQRDQVVSVGFLAPISEWTPEFKELFCHLAQGLYKRGHAMPPPAT